MSTVPRNPLANARSSRSVSRTSRSASGTKRPRSPDNEHLPESHKRRAVDNDTPAARQERDRRLSERLQKDAEWKHKYTRAFPTFHFHFDAENVDTDPATLHPLILRLGGVGPRFAHVCAH